VQLARSPGGTVMSVVVCSAGGLRGMSFCEIDVRTGVDDAYRKLHSVVVPNELLSPQ